jgi:hypothetical protein
MHGYANPARFLKFARPATGWFLALGMLLLIAGALGGLIVSPPDYLQGESVRILYIHVPAAWLGMAGWAGIATASLMQLVWRHPLAAVAAPSSSSTHRIRRRRAASSRGPHSILVRYCASVSAVAFRSASSAVRPNSPRAAGYTRSGG